VRGLNPGAQDIPVMKAQNLGDQLQALAVCNGTDLAFSASRSVCAIALASRKSRMGWFLCLSERDVRCLRADSFARANESRSGRYVHHTPTGVQAAGRIRPLKTGPVALGVVNAELQTDEAPRGSAEANPDGIDHQDILLKATCAQLNLCHHAPPEQRQGQSRPRETGWFHRVHPYRTCSK
jgi:hypothetical protein